ncbi:MAG TPA: TlpA disulfide reductase family protein [Chitinophagaceae bacterium]|nr:TlpA disulfide reductase family protein [Chitinophagaceae bacterium]
MKIFFRIMFICTLFFASCNSEDQVEKAGGNKSVIEISQIHLKNLAGDSVNLEQYKGKTIFLNFWATWCKPCLQEMPSIKTAMEIMNNKDIVFLFASDETVEQIESFKNSHDYNFNYVKAENTEALNIMALPTTFIFAPDGTLAFSEMGYKKWDDKKNIDLILNIAKQK